MREKYEGEGLELLGQITIVLAVIGGLSLVGWLGWGLWKWLS